MKILSRASPADRNTWVARSLLTRVNFDYGTGSNGWTLPRGHVARVLTQVGAVASATYSRVSMGGRCGPEHDIPGPSGLD